MSLFFNAVVGLGFMLFPQAYSVMFPKEIKEAAAPYVDKKDVKKVWLILYPLYILPDCRIYCSGHKYTAWVISVEHKEIDDLAPLYPKKPANGIDGLCREPN